MDLEHWAAFQRSFEALAALFARVGQDGPGERVGAGPAYAAPASISVLSGDVHHSYVARVRFDSDVRTPGTPADLLAVHNQVPAVAAPADVAGLVARPGVADPRAGPVRRASAGPWSAGASWPGPTSATRSARWCWHGRSAEVTIEGTTKDGDLKAVARVPLAPAPRATAATAGLAAAGSA